MSEPLKPCPFCGGAAMVQTARCAEDAIETWIECMDCTSKGVPAEDAYADIPTARAAWNRRAPVALPSREEVVEVIRSGRAYEATSDQIADAILNLMRERMG